MLRFALYTSSVRVGLVPPRRLAHTDLGLPPGLMSASRVNLQACAHWSNLVPLRGFLRVDSSMEPWLERAGPRPILGW